MHLIAMNFTKLLMRITALRGYGAFEIHAGLTMTDADEEDFNSGSAFQFKNHEPPRLRDLLNATRLTNRRPLQYCRQAGINLVIGTPGS